MTEEKLKKKNEPKSSDKVVKMPLKEKLMIGAGVLAVLVVIIGFQLFKSQKEMETRRAAYQVQRETLINKWEADGLSEKEIEQKLAENRGSGFDGRGPSIFGSVMRTFRQATGTRPGGGNFQR